MGIRVRDGAPPAGGRQTCSLPVQPTFDPRRRIAASVGLFSAAVVGGLIGFGLAGSLDQQAVPQAKPVDPGPGRLFVPAPGQERPEVPEQRAPQPARARSVQPVEPQAVERQVVAQSEPRPAPAPAPKAAAPRPAAQPVSQVQSTTADPATRTVQQAWRMAGDLMGDTNAQSATTRYYEGTPSYTYARSGYGGSQYSGSAD
jgi:hypothetical protein